MLNLFKSFIKAIDEKASPRRWRTNLHRENEVIQESAIFKLNVDCCNEIFEYLSVEDLYSFGQTCKSFQKVAGAYFNENYSAANVQIDDNNISVCLNRRYYKSMRTVKVQKFSAFISKLTIALDKSDCFEINNDEFTSIKHIELINGSVTSAKVNNIQKILEKVETVEISWCPIENDLYKSLLRLCKNLKCLHIQNFSMPDEMNWLIHDYPLLEHLKWMPTMTDEIKELNNFLERHPNVRILSINSSLFWKNQQQFLKSTAKLDLLEYEELYPKMATADSDVWCILNQLHENGFYKKINFHIRSVNKAISEKITFIRGLQKLVILEFNKSFNLINLKNLKQLDILRYPKPTEMKILAKNLTKLERIFIGDATIKDIIPFVKYSMNLMKLNVAFNDDIQSNEAHKSNAFLDCIKLNKAREKFNGAKKITVFVQENDFLETKWMNNGNINMEFVEIKRIDSINWEHQFN